MQIKSRKIFIITIFLHLLFFSSIAYTEEFNISAKEILIDKEKEIVIG